MRFARITSREEMLKKTRETRTFPARRNRPIRRSLSDVLVVVNRRVYREHGHVLSLSLFLSLSLDFKSRLFSSFFFGLKFFRMSSSSLSLPLKALELNESATRRGVVGREKCTRGFPFLERVPRDEGQKKREFFCADDVSKTSLSLSSFLS